MDRSSFPLKVGQFLAGVSVKIPICPEKWLLLSCCTFAGLTEPALAQQRPWQIFWSDGSVPPLVAEMLWQDEAKRRP